MAISLSKQDAYRAVKEAANFQMREALLEAFEPGSSIRLEIMDAITNGAYRAVFEIEQMRTGVESDGY